MSVVLPTYNRAPFLALALKFVAYQRAAGVELIIVDDSDDGEADALLEATDATVIRLATRTALGTKLNIGIEASRAPIIAKMDDDDFYGPNYLRRMILAVKQGAPTAIAFVQPFSFLRLSDNAVLSADPGRCAGGTLTFRRELWNRHAFRDAWEAVDADFLLDHGADARDPRTHSRVRAPRDFLNVRHGFHTWRHMPWGATVDSYLTTLDKSPYTLSEIAPGWVQEEYRQLGGSQMAVGGSGE